MSETHFWFEFFIQLNHSNCRTHQSCSVLERFLIRLLPTSTRQAQCRWRSSASHAASERTTWPPNWSKWRAGWRKSTTWGSRCERLAGNLPSTWWEGALTSFLIYFLDHSHTAGLLNSITHWANISNLDKVLDKHLYLLKKIFLQIYSRPI